MTTVYVPLDSFAIALEADSVADIFQKAGATVIRNGSRGLAWAEPLVEIENGDTRTAYQQVTPNIAKSLVAAGALKTEIPTHEKYLGDIEQHPFLANQQRLIFDRIGYTSPLDIPDFSDIIGTLEKEPYQIIDTIRTSGLRGRGGAGFPAHIKWQTVADTPADIRYLVCNADEGDSGTFVDRLLMEGDPFRLIEGMVIAAYATGSSKGFVYLRSEYPIAQEIFNKAINLAYQNGLLGKDILGTGVTFDLELFIGAGAYICGEETSLLESLEGKRGQIRTKPPVPAIEGLFGKPTLVHNVISYASIPGLMKATGELYANLGVKPSCGTMPFQISGNIQRGGLIELPFGVTIRQLIDDFGVGTLSGRPLRAVQIGGPLGAYLSQDELDTPLTYEALTNLGAGIGHGGLVVYDDTVDLAEQAQYAFEFCEIESCGKCTPCRIGSVRGKETMQALRDGKATAKDLTMLDDLCEVMDKASLCQMGGMTPIPVRSAMERFPEDFGTSLIVRSS
jgi:formate dehydrogenase iron-sulfur subunit